MDPIRVLVVDDSAPIRMLLAEALGTDPEVEVVAHAANGEIALREVRARQPDAIVLDLEMPVMNGLEFLAELRVIAPRLPVVVFSSMSSHGAEVTLQALWLGASDHVTKPRTTNLHAARERTAAELLPRIKAVVARERQRVDRRRPMAGAVPEPPGPGASAARHGTEARAIAIAASTGGPRALAEILRQLPPSLKTPVLIVQHMPAMFTGYLANGLATQCAIKVSEAYPGARLSPGQAWIAPGDHHMVVRPTGAGLEVALHQGPPENACRPSADPLFRSVAEHFGHDVLAVVLTGMGQDGTTGCRMIRDRGGSVIAQDEATSVVWGMPGSVVQAGLADRVLPLDAIGAEIVRRAATGGRRHAA